MSVIRTTFAFDSREAEDLKFNNAVIDKVKETCFQKLADQVQPDENYAIRLLRLNSKRADCFDGVTYEQDMIIDELGACYRCAFYGFDTFTCLRTRLPESMTNYCSHFEKKSYPFI